MYKDIYQEVAQIINEKMPEIKWVDLWANQTDYFDEELPFTLPAIFIEFNAYDISDKGKLAQIIELEIIFHIAYETMAESYQGSYNQDSALQILESLIKLHQTFHGESGENFSRMRRSDAKQEINGGNILQYAITYTTVISDQSASKEFGSINNLNLTLLKS